jgi:hypothetical protein
LELAGEYDSLMKQASRLNAYGQVVWVAHIAELLAARMFGSSPSNPAVNVAEAVRHLIGAHCTLPRADCTETLGV